MSYKKKVILIGASMRVRPFVTAMQKDYADKYELAAVMDIDPAKMQGFNESLDIDIPMYVDFEQMCDEVKPDLAIITTVDYFHAEYTVKCLDRKINCIIEKPLCVNVEQCKQIAEAQKRNPEVNAVTSHNARYHATIQKVKELLDDGAIGKVLSVNYKEMLDLEHGTSYFRRWNRRKKLSGGLQIHKSSHHFDKLNWLLKSHAVKLVASGKLIAYGKDASEFMGKKCSTCPHTDKCGHFIDRVGNDYFNQLFFKYQQTENYYSPDLCVFSPEIDIEDFFTATYEYANGIPVSYALNAHSNIEGEDIVIEGEKGRIEIIRRSPTTVDENFVEIGETVNSVKIYRFKQAEPEEVEIITGTGGHGGSDNDIFSDLFGDTPSDILATLDDGIQAVLIGCAINQALETSKKIDVQALIK
jgi:predicted dehydrogenase